MNRSICVFIFITFFASCFSTVEETEKVISVETAATQVIEYTLYRSNQERNDQGWLKIHTSVGNDSSFVNPALVKNLTVIGEASDKTFPFEVLDYKNLEYLKVGFSGFKKLPPEITQLKHLKSLDIQHAAVEELPENFGDLQKLETLILLYSNIESLPNSISEISTLRYMQLNHSYIKEFPPGLEQIDSLFIICSTDNKADLPQLKEQVEILNKKGGAVHLASTEIE